jgi:hypothetical protein
MESVRKRNETTQANQKMKEEFNGDPTSDPRDPRTQADPAAAQPDRDDIRGEAAEEANDAARVKRPYP